MDKRRNSVILLGAVMTISLLLAMALPASAAHPADDESLIGDTDAFLAALEEDGFAVKEVRLVKMDLFALCEQGYIPDCYGNNSSAPYMAVLMDDEYMPVFGTFRAMA